MKHIDFKDQKIRIRAYIHTNIYYIFIGVEGAQKSS